MYEIIYVCDSINNKNVRQGELNILEKHEEQLYFDFGSDKMNIKKRFYRDLETLNKDFDNLLKLKEKEEKRQEEQERKEIKKKEIITQAVVYEKQKEENIKDNEEEVNTKSEKYKIIKRKK